MSILILSATILMRMPPILKSFKVTVNFAVAVGIPFLISSIPLVCMALLTPCTCMITTIARGIAFGGELEYADEMTLGKSISNRQPIHQYIK